VAACAGLLWAQGRGGAAPQGKDKGPQVCDRACLEGFLTEYLDALVAHNPFGLPLARTVRFTENAQILELGDGLWNLTTGLGKYRLIVADPESQQVGFLGTVFANERPTTLALRLKLENRRITEIETLVSVANAPAAPGSPLAGAAALEALGAPEPGFSQTVPEADRRSREQLRNAVNAYLDGVERGEAGGVEFDTACNRRENGVQMTNNPTPNARGIDPRAMSCAEQLASRVLTHYQVIYPRRMPIVDEERQLVFGVFLYQQPGDRLQIEVPGRGPYRFAEAQSQPAFFAVAQVFQFSGGRIRSIEALSTPLPYGTPDPFFADGWRRGGSK
jgi:hypothetical protein